MKAWQRYHVMHIQIRYKRYQPLCLIMTHGDDESGVKGLVMVRPVYTTYIDHEMDKFHWILVCYECLYIVMSVSFHPHLPLHFSP